MKISNACVALSAVVLLSACAASGPKHSEMRASMPQLKPDQGRIYFYRTSSIVGAAMQPSITLNGRAVGESKPGGFFYVDAPAGPMEVATSTEVEKKLTFTLDRGQTRYVRTSVGFGIAVGRVYPELVDNATGEKEVQEASYTGAAAAQR
jgi:Protein of unknown function (DUF2846).